MADYWDRSPGNFLRRPTKSQMRSAYAIETNPWTTKGDVEAALLFRGTIVSAHGYIETRLAELSFRCSKSDEYRELRDKYPYTLDNRLEYLRNVFSIEPLHIHHAIAEKFFKQVESGRELRHLMAHARMQVLPDWGVVFHGFKQPKGEPMQYRQDRMLLSDLERAAWRASKLSRACQRLADGLENLEIIPPLHD